MASINAYLVKQVLHINHYFVERKIAHKKTINYPKLRKGLTRISAKNKVDKNVLVQRFEMSLRLSNGESKKMNMAWLKPRKVSQKIPAVLLYIHGGGYTIGSIDSHKAMVSKMVAASEIPALMMDYALAPEEPFPAGLADCVASYKWLLEEEGYTADRIIVGGDSAGGGLALASLLEFKNLGLPQPAGAVLLSPWTDASLTESASMNDPKEDKNDPYVKRRTLRSMALAYVAEEEAKLKNPLVSPVYADLTGLCPLLIQVGTEEILRDDAIRLAEAARKAGVVTNLEVWNDMFHVFQSFWRHLPESYEAIGRIGSFMWRKLEVSADRGKNLDRQVAASNERVKDNAVK